MDIKPMAISVALVLGIASFPAGAQPAGPMQGHGPMMGRPGHGHAYGAPSGSCPEMGPGRMGGGHYMGPDRMGGYTMGPGMMGGYRGEGMGPGMMMGGYGLGTIRRLDLSDDQRRKLAPIQDELRRKNWDLMGKIQDEMARLRDASWSPDQRDRNAILAANKRMSELRQQMLENDLDAQEKAEALLTAPQKEQLRQLRR